MLAVKQKFKNDPILFWKLFPINHKLPRPHLNGKYQTQSFYGMNVLRQYCRRQLTFIFFYNCNFYSISMMFSVSNVGIQWMVGFGSDSVIRTVEDLIHEMTESCHETPLPLWKLFLSQKQDFYDKHLAKVSITPSKQGVLEMRAAVLSNVGAQEMSTGGYQVSDLQDIELSGRSLTWIVTQTFNQA